MIALIADLAGRIDRLYKARARSAQTAYNLKRRPVSVPSDAGLSRWKAALAAAAAFWTTPAPHHHSTHSDWAGNRVCIGARPWMQPETLCKRRQTISVPGCATWTISIPMLFQIGQSNGEDLAAI